MVRLTLRTESGRPANRSVIRGESLATGGIRGCAGRTERLDVNVLFSFWLKCEWVFDHTHHWLDPHRIVTIPTCPTKWLFRGAS